MSKEKKALAEIRQKNYQRNLDFLRAFKEERGCDECELNFPHYVLDTVPSVARLAGSRCSLDVLKDTLEHVAVLCANCRKTKEWKENH